MPPSPAQASNNHRSCSSYMVAPGQTVAVLGLYKSPSEKVLEPTHLVASLRPDKIITQLVPGIYTQRVDLAGIRPLTKVRPLCGGQHLHKSSPTVVTASPHTSHSNGQSHPLMCNSNQDSTATATEGHTQTHKRYSWSTQLQRNCATGSHRHLLHKSSLLRLRGIAETHTGRQIK